MEFVALRFLERQLRLQLAAIGHGDVMEAVERVGLTDDGSTIYVHLFPEEGRSGRVRGQVYVLSWQDYAEDRAQRLDCYRWLISEAKVSIADDARDIVRWLEKR